MSDRPITGIPRSDPLRTGALVRTAPGTKLPPPPGGSAAPPEKQDERRVDVELSERGLEALREIAAETGASDDDIVNVALELYASARRASRARMVVTHVDPLEPGKLAPRLV